MKYKRKLYPDWVVATYRAWKVQKRREWREVGYALDVFQMGCVYVPASTFAKIEEVYRLSAEIRRELGVKVWGR